MNKFLIFTLLLLFTSCNLSTSGKIYTAAQSAQTVSNAAKVIKERIEINNLPDDGMSRAVLINLGDDLSRVKAILGEPSSIRYGSPKSNYDFAFKDSSTSVSIDNNNKVVSIKANSRSYHNANGYAHYEWTKENVFLWSKLKKGMNRVEATKTVGVPTQILKKDNVMRFQYAFKTKNVQSYSYGEIVFDEDYLLVERFRSPTMPR